MSRSSMRYIVLLPTDTTGVFEIYFKILERYRVHSPKVISYKHKKDKIATAYDEE